METFITVSAAVLQKDSILPLENLTLSIGDCIEELLTSHVRKLDYIVSDCPADGELLSAQLDSKQRHNGIKTFQALEN